MKPRKIHLPDGVWTWRAGRGKVVIRNPERKSFLVDISKLTGIPWSEIERARWKGGSAIYGGAVTPSLVRKYIETKLTHGNT